MSNNVGARKDGSNYIASTGPDVCKTPVGSSVVPVPYASIAFLGSAARVSSNVKRNGKSDFMLNSRTPNSMGTEPGVKKGVAKSGHLGPSAVKVTTGSVFINGYASASHKDKATINMASQSPTEKKR